MRTQNFVRNLNWVWVLTLAVIFTACSQMEGLEPDSKTLEGKSEELFRLSPFGNGFENARVPTGGTASTPKSKGGITPYTIPGANEGGNRTCDEVATAYGISSFGTSFEQRNAPFADNKATFTGSDGAVITATTDGTFVSWSIEVPAGYCVKYLAAVVKGSNDANVYFYEGDVREDSGLASPVAGGSGGAAALSNLRFCYTLEEKPQAPEVVGDEECFEEDLVLRATLADGVTTPDGYTLQWYKKVNGEFVEVDDPKLDEVGTIDYYAAFVNGCSSEMSGPATLTINPLPGAPTGGDQDKEVCDFSKLTASVKDVPDGISIVWYDAPTGGNVVTDPSLVYDASKGGVQTATFYAEAVNDDTECVSATRTMVTLTLRPCTRECVEGESATGLGSAFTNRRPA
ncbi:MAG: hypothetical protein LPJ98_05070, partial [Cyclobacteriaceae bacterium]|nr:hypothetical protein [Cyclobacteriaceae bacterium]